MRRRASPSYTGRQERLGFMRCILLIATLGTALAVNLDPQEIVRRSVAAEEAASEKPDHGYTFLERVETHQLDGDGAVKSVSSKTHEVRMIEGTPYRRLVSREDELLPPEEQREQQESLRRTIEQRRKEPASERAERLEEFKKRRDRYNKAIHEIPDAFVFHLAGEELVNSRPAYKINATPRPAYRPIDRYSRLFTELEGTLWVDKTDYRWARVDAKLIDNVNFGWILVRISKGARVRMQRTVLDGNVWFPSRLWFTVSLRIGLIKGINMEQDTVYSDFRKTRAIEEAAH